MKATILDLRYRMKDVLRALERGESVAVTHRGRERARLVSSETREKPGKLRVPEALGMWKDREDLTDVAQYVRQIRAGRFGSGKGQAGRVDAD